MIKKITVLLLTVIIMLSTTGCILGAETKSPEPLPFDVVEPAEQPEVTEPQPKEEELAQQAEKAEQERIAAEQAVAEQKKLDEEKAAKAEQERLAALQAAKIAEQQRIAAEQQAAQKQAEQQKIAEQQAALKAEQERLAAEDEALKKEEKPKTVEAEKPAIKLTGKYFDSKTEEAVIRKINRERESLGLSALEYDENLQTAARLRSKELCQAGKFEHKRPTGEAWNTVIENDIPTDYTSVGENLAMADSNRPIDRTAEEWFRQWKESQSHYETMIVPEFEYIGVGIYTKEINGRYYSYATTLFGGY